MRMHRLGAALAASLDLVLVTACSQGSTATTSGSSGASASGSVQQASGAKPAPFDKATLAATAGDLLAADRTV